jgi:hypothetical protein
MIRTPCAVRSIHRARTLTFGDGFLDSRNGCPTILPSRLQKPFRFLLVTVDGDESGIMVDGASRPEKVTYRGIRRNSIPEMLPVVSQ